MHGCRDNTQNKNEEVRDETRNNGYSSQSNR